MRDDGDGPLGVLIVTLLMVCLSVGIILYTMTG